jgi:hypothetical protein
MSNTINYVVSYDSDYLMPDGKTVNPSATVLQNVTNIQFQRNIAPSEDNATITLAGIQKIVSAREIYIYRVNSDGTYTLKFRGMTTNPEYDVSDQALVTTVQVNSLWYMLATRLFQIAGKSPPPLQPNTNPYLVYLNPTLGLRFGQLWADILVTAFQQSYSTGHLPAFQLANFADIGYVNPVTHQTTFLNPNIKAFTDFDNTVVNDNLNIQYQNISATIDRLITSALFNPQQSQPFLAEYRLDIGDYTPPGCFKGKTTTGTTALVLHDTTLSLVTNSLIGYELYYNSGTASGQFRTVTANTATTITVGVAFSPAPDASGDYYAIWPPGTVQPKTPTATVMLFDPVHSKLGNGCNRTGIPLGDNSLDYMYVTNECGTPAGVYTPSTLSYPMEYAEFGVYNGYCPIDTIVFSEGDNIVSIKFTSDYISMNNSFVLTGGSFQGSDVVAIPIDNQRSIAEYGLKQTNQTLNNVVDQGEIQRYVGTSINFFQHPIPNIILKPDYVYASTHTMYPGDYILVNAPSLGGVIEDSNGNPLVGSYNPVGGLITAAFTARIKTIDITWNPDEGEDITLTLTFPVQNVPIEQWNAVHSFQEQGSYGGAMQFMYTTVNPASKTLLGRGRQAEGGAIHQGGGDFITNRATPFQLRCEDYEDSGTVYPDAEAQAIPVYAQSIPNTMNAIDTAGNPVKADDILLYQFGVEVDASNSSSANQITTLGVTASSAPNSVYLTVIQPDGMAIYDKVINLNQLADILSLISKSHASPPTLTSSAPFLTDDGGNANVSGKYMVVIRNTGAIFWCPDPLFSTLPVASITGGTAPFQPEGSQYLYCPVDSYGNEFALSNYSISGYVATPGSHIFLSWPAVIDPTTGSAVTRYNVYRAVLGIADILTLNILQLIYLDFTATNSYEDNGTLGGDANTQPFVQSLDTSAPETPPGLNVVYDGTPVGAGSQLALGHQYWYLITAIDPDNNETALSQVCTPFNLPLSNTNTNTQPEPYNNSVPEGGTYTVAQTTGTTTAGTTATVLQDSGKAWTVNALVGFTLEYTSGPAIGEERTILSNTATSITTAAFSPAPNGSGDTYTLVSSEIVITWPSVPYAQSYNVYRADGGTSNTMPTSTSGTPLKATNYDLLVQGVMAPLQIVDDGLTYTLDTSTHPPVSYTISSANNAYTVYVNYSYQANPKFTKAIVNAQTANPNNAVVFDPTQQWVYQPHPYVSP